MKKMKIALIIDTEGWAFDNIAKQIKKHLDNYEIDIIPGRLFEGNMARLLIFCEQYDLIHFLYLLQVLSQFLLMPLSACPSPFLYLPEQSWQVHNPVLTFPIEGNIFASIAHIIVSQYTF